MDLLSIASDVDDTGVFQKAITVTNSALSPLIFWFISLTIDLSAYYRTNEVLFGPLYASGTGMSWIKVHEFYRVCSDTNYFYVQRVNPDTPSMNAWLNIATVGYNTTTKTSSCWMNSQDILTSLASKVDSTELILEQQQLKI